MYQYFKKLVDLPDDKLNNWRDVISYCEQTGYKSLDINNNSGTEILSKLNNNMPLDAFIKIIDLGFQNENNNHNFTIDINIRLTLTNDKNILQNDEA